MERILPIIAGLVVTAAGVVLAWRALPDSVGAHDEEESTYRVLWVPVGIGLALAGILIAANIPWKDVVAFVEKMFAALQ